MFNEVVAVRYSRREECARDEEVVNAADRRDSAASTQALQGTGDRHAPISSLPPAAVISMFGTALFATRCIGMSRRILKALWRRSNLINL